MEIKICAKCRVEKGFEEFINHKGKTNGIGSYCKLCASAINKEWRLTNPEIVRERRKLRRMRLEVKEKEREYSKEYYSRPEIRKHANEVQSTWRKKNPAYRMWQVAKERSKNKGLTFDLEVDDIVIPELCPILGIPLIVGDGKCHQGSPSIDKIKPELGYVKGNIQVISMKANAIKNNATFEELVVVGKWAQEQLTKCLTTLD